MPPEEDSADASRFKKLQAPAIKWVQQDIDLMVEWFCKRNENGIPINNEAWVTRTHTDVAERMLEETGLANKQLATKKKASDKIDAIVKKYEDMRIKAEGSGWGTDIETHKQHQLASIHGPTVKEYMLKKCPWYYDFESLYHDHPSVKPPAIIDYFQPPRRNGQAVKETDIGGIDNPIDAEGDVEEGPQEDRVSTHENEKEDASGSDLQQSAHSQAERVARASGAEPSTAKIIAISLGDDEDYSYLDDVPRIQPRIPRTLVPYRSETAPVESIEQSSAKPTKQTPRVPKETPKEAPKEGAKARSKSKRSLPMPGDSDSEEETEKSRRDRWKKTKWRLTLAEAMLEEAKMKDSRLRDQAKADREERQRQHKLEMEERQQQYKLEFQQREHHHAALMARHQLLIDQSQESLLRVQLELSKETAF